MAPIPQLTHWSPEAYLEAEATSKVKHDYWDGQLYAMAGASPNHDRIVGNTQFAVRLQLQGRDCEVFTSDIRIKVHPQAAYTYPDATIGCGKAEFDDKNNLLNPTVIIEVSSRSTERYDHDKKFDYYTKLASLQEYILIRQDAIRVGQYIRADDEWRYRVSIGLETIIELPSIMCQLKLADIYQCVEFPTG